MSPDIGVKLFHGACVTVCLCSPPRSYHGHETFDSAYTLEPAYNRRECFKYVRTITTVIDPHGHYSHYYVPNA